MNKIREGELLYVKRSLIPHANMGLFAIADIKKGYILCEYAGVEVGVNEYRKNPTGYGVQISKHVIIDGYRSGGYGRYANTCKKSDIENGHCIKNNVRYSVHYVDGVARVNLKALCNIKADSEIYASYGRGFWVPDQKTLNAGQDLCI